MSTTPTDTATAAVLPRATWTGLATAHAERAEGLTAAYRERRQTRTTHAVDDFLFTYYPVKPGVLARWSPGVGLALAEAEGSAFDGARWFVLRDGVARLDTEAYLADRGGAVRFHERLLGAVAERPARFDCFGLHEWAMVYGEAAGDHRHALPLRLGEEATDEVVRSHRVQCSHIDAFRFFTPEAIGFNTLSPTRETQVEMDQAGCLHVGMDLVKTSIHLGPAVPGELALDAFELARDIRTLDMRASPYDVSSLGLAPVAIETPAGKAEYVTAQREFSERAAGVRARLWQVCRELLAA